MKTKTKLLIAALFVPILLLAMTGFAIAQNGGYTDEELAQAQSDYELFVCIFVGMFFSVGVILAVYRIVPSDDDLGHGYCSPAKLPDRWED